METKLKVSLLTYTPDAEKVAAEAAKLCYSSAGIDALSEQMTPERVESFLNHLMSLGHESPLEHASFTFGVEGVSRSLLAQLTRHRLASYSVKSQRYVKEGQFHYIVPPEIAKLPEAAEIFQKTMAYEQEQYDRLTELLLEKHINALMAEGLDEKEAFRKAEKMAIEDARYVLPNACETKLVMTMNVRSLYNFFHHRCCERAQWEIRHLAEEMLALVKGAAPLLFQNCGPRCVKGPCPEGKMSCGKQAEKRERFGGK